MAHVGELLQPIFHTKSWQESRGLGTQVSFIATYNRLQSSISNTIIYSENIQIFKATIRVFYYISEHINGDGNRHQEVVTLVIDGRAYLLIKRQYSLH